MPTYSIKAPNGQTYQIDGPAGASDDAVRAEVMRQHPDAVGAPSNSFLGTAGRVVQNLGNDVGDTINGLAKLPSQVVDAVTHPAQTVQAASNAVGNAANIATGGLQRVRDMSPAAYQGNAPHMDTTAYDNFANDLYNKYGTLKNIGNTLVNHPLAPALAAASVAVPALGIPERLAALGDAADTAGAGVTGAATQAANTAQSMVGAGTRANAAAAQMRGAATTQLGGMADATAADQAATVAQQADLTTRAGRLSALAQRAQARRATLADRSSADLANATPPTPEFSAPTTLSDAGNTARAPAMANQADIETKMRAADAQYRGAMQQVASDQASAGVGVSDTPEAQQLIANSKAAIDPDPVNRSAVGFTPANSAGGKLHADLLDALEPKNVPLSPAQAAQAKAIGVDVQTAPDGSAFRVVKPDLETVDNFRRFVGQVASGNVEGYPAINRLQAGQMYKGLQDAIDTYAQGASKPVQENWAAGKAALAPFENVKAGQAIVGTQAGTGGIANVPAANIPGRIIAGGRDTVNQAAAVAGQGPVSQVLRSQVQNALSGAKNADAMQALVNPTTTTLGDAISTDPDLEKAVSDFISQTRAAEASGASATDLAARASTNANRATALSQNASNTNDIADALNNNVQKLTATARGYQRELTDLQIADPKQVGPKYLDILSRAHASGTITDEQYAAGAQLAQSAQKDFALKTTRDRWLAGAAGTLGIGTLGVQGFHALTGGH